MKLKTQTGFTLVELMIATSVFSVVMLVGLYTFLSISRTYTKGIAVVRTQDAVRNLEMDIANQLQFSGDKGYTDEVSVGSPSGGYKARCIGNKAYVYRLNVIEDGNGSALRSYEITPDNTCATSYPSSGYDVLLKNGTSVIAFSIAGSSPLYKIDISLLNDSQGFDSDLVDSSDSDPLNWTCKTAIRGSEYCALAKISTVVYKRIGQ